MNEHDAPDAFFELMHELWHLCARLIVDGIDYPFFVGALKRHHACLPTDAREMVAWPAFLAMGRVAWRRMPQPRLNYALAVVVTAQRNAPCSCGSGRKYKQCCLPLEHALPAGAEQVSMLPIWLEHLPRNRWQELAGSRVSVEMLGQAAFKWNEDGRAKDVSALLQPWFVADADFQARRESLFDALLDAYTALPRPRKKAQLLARAQAVGDRRIRSAAMQRRATMLADEGDYHAAWQLFAQAQRADPQSPSLAHLEVTLLMSEGRHAEARERARFWAHRLAAMRDPELHELVDFMRDVAERGAAAMQQFFFEQEPELGELAALLQEAPPIAVLYTLKPSADAAGPLKPKPALRKALQAWDAATGGDVSLLDMVEPPDDDIAAWLSVLRAHPPLWSAFEVLNHIVDAVHAREVGAFDEAIVCPVLERAELLLREVLRANHAEGKTLEWGWLENRPALRLLGERIVSQGEGSDDPTDLARLEWLVCTLNPNDNQGFRHSLVRAYLRAGRPADALALCERYPDDYAAMQYNHALALFALDRRGDATIALQRAVAAYPKPLAWLLKANPKAPRLDPYGVAVGGDDEAWCYRQETLPLWEKLGALAWLHSCAKTLNRRG